MEQYKNFVVYGPGRTGSHWVESLLIGLFDVTHYRHGQCSMLIDRWIYHTNNISDLIDIPREIRDSITLLVCDRSSIFDTAISYIVAKETTEFFLYSDKTIDPFRIDPGYFKELLDNYQFNLDEFNRTVAPIYSSVIRIDYDALSTAKVPEKYIADQLGVNYVTNLDYQHGSIKNPRNYKELILNWEELHQLF